MKKGFAKFLKIVLVVIVVIAIGGSVAMGGYITDRILNQNKNNDTVGNSVKQLATWGYDLDGFNSKYQGVEISAEAEDGNVVPGMESLLRLMFGDGPEGAYSGMTNYLIGTTKAYMKVIKGIDFADGDTVKEVAKDSIPTMVIVSEKDEVCLPEMVEKVYENVGSSVKSVAYVDSAHIEGVIDDKEGYRKDVREFLDPLGL